MVTNDLPTMPRPELLYYLIYGGGGEIRFRVYGTKKKL